MNEHTGGLTIDERNKSRKTMIIEKRLLKDGGRLSKFIGERFSWSIFFPPVSSRYN